MGWLQARVISETSNANLTVAVVQHRLSAHQERCLMRALMRVELQALWPESAEESYVLRDARPVSPDPPLQAFV